MKKVLRQKLANWLLPTSLLLHSFAILFAVEQVYPLQNVLQLGGLLAFLGFAVCRYRLSQPEMLFSVFFLAYTYPYAFPNIILNNSIIVDSPMYLTKSIHPEPLVVNYLVTVLYICYFLLFSPDSHANASVCVRVPSRLLQNVVAVAFVIVYIVFFSFMFSQFDIHSYFTSNKLERSQALPAFFDYAILSTMAFVTLNLFSGIDLLIRRILIGFLFLSVVFHVLSGERELVVAFPLAYILVKKPNISFLKASFLGFGLLASLSYLKMIHPYLGYLLIGKDAVFTVDVEKYLTSVFFNGEFYANFVLFNRFVDVNFAELNQLQFLWDYFAYFLPLTQTFFTTKFPTIGEQLLNYFNVWGGLASHPHIYPYATFGYFGVFLSTVFLLVNFYFLTLPYYWSHSWSIKIVVVTALTNFVFFINRNELYFTVKVFYKVFYGCVILMGLSILLLPLFKVVFHQGRDS